MGPVILSIRNYNDSRNVLHKRILHSKQSSRTASVELEIYSWKKFTTINSVLNRLLVYAGLMSGIR